MSRTAARLPDLIFRHTEAVMGTVVSFDVRPRGLPWSARALPSRTHVVCCTGPMTCSAFTGATAPSAGCGAGS